MIQNTSNTGGPHPILTGNLQLSAGHPLAILVYFYFALACLSIWLFARIRRQMGLVRFQLRGQGRKARVQAIKARGQVRAGRELARSLYFQVKALPNLAYLAIVKSLRKRVMTTVLPYFAARKLVSRLFIRSLIHSSFSQLHKLKKN